MPDQTVNPDIMPAAVHGEEVVSAFRHLPPYGRLDCTWTVITLDPDSPEDQRRYNVFRTRFAPALGRWSIDVGYRVDSDLSWTAAVTGFVMRITGRD